MSDRPRRGTGEGRARRNSSTPRFSTRKKVCEFTRLGIEPDYKDISRLQKYVSQQGKIMPRRRTGCTAKMQRLLTIAIKRARHMSLLPYVASHAVDRRPLGGGRDRDRDR